MRLTPLAAAALACLALGACDDGEEERPKTVVETVTTPADTGPATTEPEVPAQTETTPAPVQKEPLPGGRAAVDGRYAMVLRRFVPADLCVVPQTDEPTEWIAEASCTSASDCEVLLRRPLASGAFKRYTLRPEGPRNYAASATGRLQRRDVTGTFPCKGPIDSPPSTRERVAVRVTEIATVDGRPTATGLDAYLVVRGRCTSNDPRLRTTFRLTASFRGRRTG